MPLPTSQEFRLWHARHGSAYRVRYGNYWEVDANGGDIEWQPCEHALPFTQDTLLTRGRQFQLRYLVGHWGVQAPEGFWTLYGSEEEAWRLTMETEPAP